MSSKNIFALTAGALLVASVYGPARAAETNTSDSSAAKQAEPVTLEKVTVSSRRRVEKEQDVPTPISVISGQVLEEKGLYQVQDLQQALPNVTSQFLHARQSSIAVRGIGNNTANEGLEGSVGIYLDNVYLGRPGQAVFDLLDLQQIELARGPQGTLFGKNTTAGVLNITTEQPTFDKVGHLEATLGNRKYEQFKGGYSGPLNDTVAVRVSAYKTHDDGWLKNLNGGPNLDEINRQGLRGQVLYKPNNDFNLRLIAESNAEHSSTGTLVPYSYGPLPASTPANPLTYADRLTKLGATPITNPYNYQVNLDAPQQANIAQDAYSAEANWKLGDYTLTSISAWRFWNFSPKNDLDTSTLPGITGGFKTHEDQFSQELRLASPTGGFSDYVVGGYYYHQNVHSNNEYDTGASGSATSGASYPSNGILSGYGEAKTDSLAVFGQDTLHFNKQFDLTTGLRATSENKKAHVIQNVTTTSAGVPFSGPLAVYSTTPVLAAWDSGALGHTDNSFAGLLTPSYRLNEQVLTFATLSHGEKSGGYNVNSVASPGSTYGPGSAAGLALITIKPEKANNAELGVKTTWLENRVQVNANLFLTKVRDYQAISTLYNAASNSYLSYLTNVGDVTSKGLEWDIKAAASKNLTLTFNGAYTSAKFDNGQGSTPFEKYNISATPALQGYGKGFILLAGNTLNGAPKWIGNLGGEYKIRSTNNDEQYYDVNVALRSTSFGDINNSSLSKIPGYGLLNLRAGYRFGQSSSGRWDASVFAKNALNKHYFLGLTSTSSMYAASAGEPLTVGAKLRYDFY